VDGSLRLENLAQYVAVDVCDQSLLVIFCVTSKLYNISCSFFVICPPRLRAQSPFDAEERAYTPHAYLQVFDIDAELFLVFKGAVFCEHRRGSLHNSSGRELVKPQLPAGASTLHISQLPVFR